MKIEKIDIAEIGTFVPDVIPGILITRFVEHGLGVLYPMTIRECNTVEFLDQWEDHFETKPKYLTIDGTYHIPAILIAIQVRVSMGVPTDDLRMIPVIKN